MLTNKYITNDQIHKVQLQDNEIDEDFDNEENQYEQNQNNTNQYINIQQNPQISTQQQKFQKTYHSVQININDLLNNANPHQVAEDLVYNQGKKTLKPQLSKVSLSSYQNGNKQQNQYNKENHYLKNYSTDLQSLHTLQNDGYVNQKNVSEYTKISLQILKESKEKPETQIKKLIDDKQLVSSVRNIDYQEQHKQKFLQPSMSSTEDNFYPQNSEFKNKHLLSPQNTNEMVQRLFTENKIRDKKREILQQQYLKEQQKQCTFQPNPEKKNKEKQQQQSYQDQQSSESDSMTQSQSIQKTSQQLFYDNQQLLKQKADQLIQIKQNRYQEEQLKLLKNKPQISNKSQILAQKKLNNSGSSSNVIERLYGERNRKISIDNKSQSQATSNYDQSQFNNSKNKFLSRNKTQKSLYNNKNMEVSNASTQQIIPLDQVYGFDVNQKYHDKVLETQRINQSKYEKKGELTKEQLNKVNLVNSSALVQKFEKDFNKSCFQQTNNPQSQWITYLQMTQILIDLGFLNHEYNYDWVSGHENASSTIAQKIWLQIKGKKDLMLDDQTQTPQKSALKRNLFLFLLAVQKIYDTNFHIQKINDQEYEEHLTTERQEFQDNQTIQTQQDPQDYVIQYENDKNPKNISKGLQPDERNELSVVPQDISEQIYTGETPYKLQDNTNRQQQPNIHTQTENHIFFQKQIASLIQNINLFGNFDKNGNLELTKKDVNEIHKIYNQLNLTKLAQKKSEFVYQNDNQMDNNIPYISNITKQLANNKENKMKSYLLEQNPNIKNLDKYTLFSYQQNQAKENLEYKKELLIQEELEGCTFKPKTKDFSTVQKHFEHSLKKKKEIELEQKLGNYSTTKNQTPTASLGVSRSIELFNLNKPFIQKRDRQKEEIDYEKDCDECTFQPDVHPRLNYNYNHINYITQKSGEKAIQRLKLGRLKKQLIEEQKSKGFTTNNQKRGKQFEKSKDQISAQITIYNSPQPFFGQNSISIYNSVNKSQNQMSMSKSNNSQNKIKKYNKNNYLNNNFLEPNQLYQNNENTSKSPSPSSFRQSPRQNQINKQYQQDIMQLELDQQQQLQQINDKDQNSPKDANSQSKQAISVSQQSQKTNNDEDKVPLLFVDVNIEEGKTARIVVFEGDRSEDLADKFSKQYSLGDHMKSKLKDLLDQQINSLLTKIEEELQSDSDI